MTTAEKIARSSDKTIFTLHREGIFFKCYNENANVFVKKVREYEVSSKYVKNVGATVSSLGFPVSLVSKGNLILDMMCGLLGAEKYDYGKVRVVVHSGTGITRSLFR